MSKSSKERLKNDLQTIEKIQNITSEILSNFDNLYANDNDLLTKLADIGNLFEGDHLAWCQDDPGCIRNIHGYRTHKRGSNDINKYGAKLNFDWLINLSKIVDDNEYKSLLTANKDLLYQSLKSFQESISFILANPTDEDIRGKESPNHIGFLEKIAAFYHDYKALENLERLVEEYNIYSQEELFNTDKVFDKTEKYYLGRLFFKLGETAKTVSDYIKPQNHTKNITLDPLRFFFGKLKKYRDEIKQHPDILYDKKSTKLLQMKLCFDESLCKGLLNVIQNIKSHFLDSLLDKTDCHITSNRIDARYGDVSLQNDFLTNHNKELSVVSFYLKYGVNDFSMIQDINLNKIEAEIETIQKATDKLRKELKHIQDVLSQDLKVQVSASSTLIGLVKKVFNSRQVKKLREQINKFTPEQSQIIEKSLEDNQ